MKALKNIRQLMTLEPAAQKDGRRLSTDDLGILENATMVIDGDKILWCGKDEELPSQYANIATVDCSSLIITPEIVDSHTHAVFGGNRAFEYTMRLNGAGYEEIAAAGGGILSTMEKTRSAELQSLFDSACVRIERIHSYGVGTIEIKSGYALSYQKEKEISELIHKLKEKYRGKIQIFNTYLAAHAVPKNYASSNQYIQEVVIPLMKELASTKTIDAVDIFHERGYFDEKDVRDLFSEAKALCIPVKMHADEFYDNDGAAIACEYGALSADHLLATSAKGISAFANSDTVATLLPGTAFFLGKNLANARAFLDAGCKVALASDYNPGSCHCDNLVLLASLAGKNLQMNIAEIWAAITLNASAALGMKDQGSLMPGQKARISAFECESFDEILYGWGRNFSVDTKALLAP